MQKACRDIHLKSKGNDHGRRRAYSDAGEGRERYGHVSFPFARNDLQSGVSIKSSQSLPVNSEGGVFHSNKKDEKLIYHHLTRQYSDEKIGSRSPSETPSEPGAMELPSNPNGYISGDGDAITARDLMQFSKKRKKMLKINICELENSCDKQENTI